MDRALRGNRLTKKPKRGKLNPGMTRRPPEKRDPLEDLGLMATGGWKGKPHSTKEGRIASGARNLTRFFYGRKKKGVMV